MTTPTKMVASTTTHMSHFYCYYHISHYNWTDWHRKSRNTSNCRGHMHKTIGKWTLLYSLLSLQAVYHFTHGAILGHQSAVCSQWPSVAWCPIYNNKGCLFKMDHNVWVYFSRITFRESLGQQLIQLWKVSISILKLHLKLDLIHYFRSDMYLIVFSSLKDLSAVKINYSYWNVKLSLILAIVELLGRNVAE